MATGGGEGGLSDECFGENCTNCVQKNRVKEAQQYCTECRKNLCFDCVEIHNDYEGHTLVGGTRGCDEEVNLLTEKCEKHKDKLIELFCVDHGELVCSICALLEHRKCDDLKHITSSIEDLNKDQKLDAITEHLKNTLQNVDQAIDSLDQHIDELSQRKHKFLEEIEKYTKRLLAKIETLRQNARKEISTKHAPADSEATEKRTVCINAKTDIIKCMNDMTSAGNRKAHLFILKKKGQCITKNVETLCRESENMMKTNTLVFKPDWNIEGRLNDFISLVTDGEKYKVSMMMDIDASIKDDSQSCDIMGCCLLSDGTVLLTDDNNCRVKHLDSFDGTIKNHVDLKGYLRGITCIGPNQFAVGTRSSSVQVISHGNKMTSTSTIQLNHDCSRIALSNGELFTTDANHVYVHDLTGTLLRTICKNEAGENMFSHIGGMVINQTGGRVYVTDWKMGLICIDRTGHEVFRRPVEELGLSGAYGVCTDQRDNLLVCGYGSNNVVQVTEDGRVIGQIMSRTAGIENPRCLCYDADRRRLYVGGSSSKLLVYQLM